MYSALLRLSASLARLKPKPSTWSLMHQPDLGQICLIKDYSHSQRITTFFSYIPVALSVTDLKYQQQHLFLTHTHVSEAKPCSGNCWPWPRPESQPFSIATMLSSASVLPECVLKIISIKVILIVAECVELSANIHNAAILNTGALPFSVQKSKFISLAQLLNHGSYDKKCKLSKAPTWWDPMTLTLTDREHLLSILKWWGCCWS